MQEKAGGRIVKSALAAEKEGACGYISALAAKGVVTSIGHSDATYDETLAAVNAGATCFVHTYNGQRGLHHRDPGVTGAAMTTNGTYAEIICDGRHVVPLCHQGACDGQGWQHTVLITDCLGCGGMPEGEYMSGGPARGHEGRPVLPAARGRHHRLHRGLGAHARPGCEETSSIGQIVTAEQAIRMALEVAARSAHVDDKVGFILPGRAADMTIFNNDLTLNDTYVGGGFGQRIAAHAIA